jgi:hypothetical protein
MQEILFLVEEAEDGSFRASAAAAAIHTEADTLEDLHREIRDAVVCHFDPGQAPPLIRLHHVRQELLGPVRIPRDVNGPLLADRLRRHGYEVTRQTGSHMRLSRSP